MYKIVCVTNRKLCSGALSEQLRAALAAKPEAVILREKDLSTEEYENLAREILPICKEAGVPCILHSFPAVAHRLGAEALHLPMSMLRELEGSFPILGASCHSVREAVEAQQRGCTYVTAGHIYATDCKKGLPGRGLDFLREVCAAVEIPVYAIGGVTPERVPELLAAGAAGACVMSSWLEAADPAAYLRTLQNP